MGTPGFPGVPLLRRGIEVPRRSTLIPEKGECGRRCREKFSERGEFLGWKRLTTVRICVKITLAFDWRAVRRDVRAV